MDDELIFCPYCKRGTRGNYLFCPWCANKLDDKFKRLWEKLKKYGNRTEDMEILRLMETMEHE